MGWLGASFRKVRLGKFAVGTLVRTAATNANVLFLTFDVVTLRVRSCFSTPTSKSARRGPGFARCPHLRIEIWGTQVYGRVFISDWVGCG